MRVGAATHRAAGRRHPGPPDRRATTVVGVADPYAFPAGTCQPAGTNGVRVYAPGSANSEIVLITGKTCANPAVRTLTVEPPTAG